MSDAYSIESHALWQWDTTGPSPIVTGYPSATGFTPTKTGLLPNDVRNFIGVPLALYNTVPPTPITDDQIMQWIRWAEDDLEQDAGVLLCQTWIASPPARNTYECDQIGVIPATSAGYQIRGYDYDLEDAAYDFFIQNSEDEGWTIQQLRYKPLQSLTYTQGDETALKNLAYRYPLLNTYFRPARTWFAEDHDAALVRLVPAGNISMLPIFQMQLTALGFADNIPAAMWMQYTAGLTPYDYQNRYGFIKQLVLAMTAIQGLRIIQGTINLGMKGIQTSVDGLQQRFDYDIAGPYNGLIISFTAQKDDLLKRLKDKVGGFLLTVL